MVLLEGIGGGKKGYWGYIENGEERIRIDSVPAPNAIPIQGQENIPKELDNLKDFARKDGSKYYFIDSLAKKDCNSFAIAYLTFEV